MRYFQVSEIFIEVTKPKTEAKLVDSNKGESSADFFPADNFLQEVFNEDYFIINKPKSNGTGGDGYWVLKKENRLYIAVFDCMGHGHLANMITRVYGSALEKVVAQAPIEFAGPVLQFIHREIESKFEGKSQKQVSTGADLGIVIIDVSKKVVEFAGAKIDLIKIQDNTVEVIKGDRMQVGEMFEYRHQYNSNTITIESNQVSFYLATDGAKDIIGGKADRKIGSGDLRKVLLAHSHRSMKDQQKLIYKFLESWRGENEPSDDVLMVGFSFN